MWIGFGKTGRMRGSWGSDGGQNRCREGVPPWPSGPSKVKKRGHALIRRVCSGLQKRGGSLVPDFSEAVTLLSGEDRVALLPVAGAEFVGLQRVDHANYFLRVTAH